MKTKVCLHCKKTYSAKDQRNIYCSKECYGLDKKGVNHRKWKGGKTINRGYAWLYMPDHPMANHGRGHLYVMEHRYIMSQHLGRILNKTECVHHKNRNKLDNRIENLELTNRSRHQYEHAHEFLSRRIRDNKGRFI